MSITHGTTTAPPDVAAPSDGGGPRRYIAAWGFVSNRYHIIGPELVTTFIDKVPQTVGDVREIYTELQEAARLQERRLREDGPLPIDTLFPPDEQFARWRNYAQRLCDSNASSFGWGILPEPLTLWCNLIHIRPVVETFEADDEDHDGFVMVGDCLRHLYLDSGYAPPAFDDIPIYHEEMVMLLDHHHPDRDEPLNYIDEVDAALYLRELKTKATP